MARSSEDERAPGRLDTEPIRAWRVWRARAREGTLQSLVWGTPWPERRAHKAQCTASVLGGGTEYHMGSTDSPTVECNCGIWAYNTAEDARERFMLTHAQTSRAWEFDLNVCDVAVWGTMNIWGRVIQHERGWRAQYAYPYSIIVPEHELYSAQAVANKIRAVYAVDVEVMK